MIVEKNQARESTRLQQTDQGALICGPSGCGKTTNTRTLAVFYGKSLISFTIRVRTAAEQITYTTLGTDSAAVIMAAIDRFGACAVTAKPAGAGAAQ